MTYLHSIRPQITLFTIGYENHTIDSLISTLRNNNISTLIDIREVAWSRKTGFSRSQLSISLEMQNIDYIHMKQLGNPKDIRKTEAPIESILDKYRYHLTNNRMALVELYDLLCTSEFSRNNLCLMCYEEDPGTCHRSIVSASIATYFPNIIISNLY